MASLLSRLRTLVIVGSLVGTAALVPSLASATPVKPAEPTISSVQTQLRTLAVRNNQVVEQFNEARIEVTKRTARAASAASAAAAAAAHYAAAHQQFVQIIQAQYENQSMGAAGALLDSNSNSNYLDRLDTLNVISNQTAEVVTEVTRSRAAAAAASATADAMLARARATRAALADKRSAVQTQIAKYQALLDTLTAAQKAAFARAALQLRAATPKQTHAAVAKVQKALKQPSTFVGSTGAGSAAAQRAVKFALAQVGKPYVWGSAGPGSYDCSGLTMASWRAGGVSLPHSSRAQYGYGHHVSRGQLQPGDLLFFYHPIGHVTIYIGNGLMVSAPTEGEPVAVVSLSSFNSDYVGATRLV